MRKILLPFIALLAIISTFVLWQNYKYETYRHMFNSNCIGINLVREKQMSDDDVHTLFSELAQRYKVNIFKRIHHNDKSLTVFSLDTSFNSLPLKSGTYPTSESSSFISNQVSNQPEQTGVFAYPDNSLNIQIKNFRALESMGGYQGIIYLGTDNMSVARKIIAELQEKVGTCGITFIYSREGLFRKLITFVRLNMQKLVLVFICGILYTFVLLHYCIHRSKFLGILGLHGYSFAETLIYLQKEVSKITIFSFIASLFLIAVYVVHTSSYDYWLTIIVICAALHLAIYLYSLLLISIFSYIQLNLYSIQSIIKGEKPFAFIISLHLALKIVLLITLAFYFNSAFNEWNYVEELRNNDLAWEDAKNVYRLRAQLITRDLKAKRPLEMRAKAVYQELTRTKDLFLLDVRNYDTLANGQTLSEANSKAGTDRFSRSGESIAVNKSYLSMKQIKNALTGKLVTDNLVYADRTLNVLVPISLRKYEREIKQNFQKNFHFMKVDVPNIYHREFKEAEESLNLDQLQINIIYIADGIKHFTYNDWIAPKEHNLITNALIMVDTGNLDPSFYYSWMTNSCFFTSENIDPLADLLPIIKKHNMQASYTSVAGIYDLRAEKLATLQANIKQLIALQIVLLVALISTIVSFNTCLYERNKKLIYVQRIHGYSFFAINKWSFFINLSMTLLLLFITRVPLAVLGLSLLAELMTIVLGNYVLLNRTLAQAIKERE